MNEKRIRCLKNISQSAGPVVYWMSREQRTIDNWALAYAQALAIKNSSSLEVLFCLHSDDMDAQEPHRGFMLFGLREVHKALEEKNIPFHLLNGDPVQIIPRLLNAAHCSILVTDFSPLREKRACKDAVVQKLSATVFEVDAHNIVPCWEASSHLEYGAYTIRPKINKLLVQYQDSCPPLIPHPFNNSLPMLTPGSGINGIENCPDTGHHIFPPGQKAALKQLAQFLDTKLINYASTHNDPTIDGQSELSPYIHYGQLSAQKVFASVIRSTYEERIGAAFLEEFVVRRELAENYCLYNSYYDKIKGFPAWAQETLEKHRYDKRNYLYSKTSLEAAETHDPAWNAAQKQLLHTGKMHGYMREPFA